MLPEELFFLVLVLNSPLSSSSLLSNKLLPSFFFAVRGDPYNHYMKVSIHEYNSR